MLKEAARLRSQGRRREAEILLTRAQQTDGDNLAVWQAMLSLQLQITEEAIQALPGLPKPRGNALVEAAKELERARSTLNLKDASLRALFDRFRGKARHSSSRCLRNR
jgi:hypothetical protein